MKNKKSIYEMNRRYGIRKLTVGVCSVLLSTMFITTTGGKKVRAAKKNEDDVTEVISESPAVDIQAPEVAISQNTVIQMEDNEENTVDNTEQDSESSTENTTVESQIEEIIPVQEENTVVGATSESNDSNTTNYANTVDSMSGQEAQEATIQIESQYNAVSSANITEENTADNTTEVTDNAETNTNTISEAPVQQASVQADVITPEVYIGDEIRYVLPDQDLTDLASSFVKNAADLTAAGLTIRWKDVPTVSKDQMGQEVGGTLLIGSVNTQTIDVTFKVEPMASKRTTDLVEATPGFYYVSDIGDLIDSVEDPDDIFNIKIYNSQDESHSLILLTDLNEKNIEMKIGEVDTSQVGLYHMDIQIIDKNPNLVGSNSYILQVPYIVQKLKPIFGTEYKINILQSEFTDHGLADSSSNITGYGRFFFENYLEFLALGGTTAASVVEPPITVAPTLLISFNRFSHSYAESFHINWVNKNDVKLVLENNYVFEGEKNVQSENLVPVLELEDGTKVTAISYEIGGISPSGIIQYNDIVFDDLNKGNDATKLPLLYFVDDSFKLTQSAKDVILSINPNAQLSNKEYSPTKFNLEGSLNYVPVPSSQKVYLNSGKYTVDGFSDLVVAGLPNGTTFTLVGSDGNEIDEIAITNNTTVRVKVTLPGSAQSSSIYTVDVIVPVIEIISDNYESTYNNKQVTVPRSSVQITTDKGEDKYGLLPSDLTFYDYDGTKIENPIYAGIYRLGLSKAGVQFVKDIVRDRLNLDINLSPSNCGVDYTINKAPVTIIMNDIQRTYNDDYLSMIDDISVNLKSADFLNINIDYPSQDKLNSCYTIFDKDNNEVTEDTIINVGTYNLKLNDQGKLWLKNELSSTNVDYNSLDFSDVYSYSPKLIVSPLEVTHTDKFILDGKTYDGEPADLNGSSIKVTVASHEVDIPLTSEDYEWADGQAPVNAGTYDVKFTNSFYNKLQKAIDEKVGVGNIVINADDSAKYTINKFIVQNAEVITPLYQVEGNVDFKPTILLYDNPMELTNVTLDDATFEFEDSNGAVTNLSLLKDPDIYKITPITDEIRQSLESQSQYSSNFDWSSTSYSLKNPTLTIISAPQDGSVHKNAGSSYTISEFKPNMMQVGVNELDWPEGTQFVMLDENGNPIDQLDLTDERTVIQVKVILPDSAKTELVYKTQVNPIHATGITISPVAGEKYEKVYDTSGAVVPPVAISLNVNPGVEIPESAKNITLTLDKFSFIDEVGNKVTPTNAGNYRIILNDAGLAAIGQLLGNEFTLTYDPATSYIDYQISTIPMQVDLQKVYEKTFDNTDHVGDIFVKLSFVSFEGDPEKEVVLQPKDYIIVGKDSAVLNVGSYDIQLTEAGRKHLKEEAFDWKVDASNTDYSIFETNLIIKNAIQVNAAKVEKVDLTLNESSKTYDGQPADLDGSSVKVTVAVHEVDIPNLTSEDYEWTDGQAPVNADTYGIRFTDNFCEKLQKAIDKKVGIGNVVVNKDAIADDLVTCTYIIDPTASVIKLSGTSYKMEDGTHTAPTGISVMLEGFNELSDIEWQIGDFEYQDENKTEVINPQSVGNYSLWLTTQGKEHIKAQLDNVAQSNIDWDKTTINNGGNYIIISDPAGSIHKLVGTYTLDELEIIPDKMINTQFELDWPEGTQFVMLDETGNPIDQLDLTDEKTVIQVKVILPDSAKTELVYKTQVNPIHATGIIISPVAGEKYEKVYDTSGAVVPPVAISLTVNPGVEIPENAKNITLTPTEFLFIDEAGNKVTPTNAGNYRIILNDAGLAAIGQLLGNEFALTYDPATSYIDYQISTIPMQVDLQKVYEKTFDNTDHVGDIFVKLSFVSFEDDPEKEVVLQPEDYIIVGKDSAVLNVGSYDIQLTEAGRKHLKEEAFDWKVDASNTDYSIFETNVIIKDAIQVNAAKVEKVNLALNESNKTYDGQDAVIPEYTISIEIKNIDNANNILFTVNGDGLIWSDGNVPVNVGKYGLTIADDFQAKLQDILNEKYGIANVVLSDLNLNKTEFDYTIEKASATVEIIGNQTTEYTGNSVMLDPEKFVMSIFTDNSFDVKLNEKLTSADLIINGDAVELGEYEVSLSDKLLAEIAKVYNNYNINFVTAAKLNIVESTYVTLTGNSQVQYNGQPVTIDPADFSVELSNGLIYNLQDGDLQFVSTGSHSDVGSYLVELSNQGKQNIDKITSQAHSYKFTGQGVLTITPKQVAPIVVGEQVAAYTKAEELHPENFTINFDNQTVTVQKDELKIEGFEIGEIPTEAGEYNVIITESLFKRLQAENPNYTFVDNSGVSLRMRVRSKARLGVYVITPITASVKLNGGQTITYGQDTSLKSENYHVDLIDEFGNIVDDFKLNDEDLEFVTIPSDAGKYTVKLTADALEKIAVLGGSNYSEWQAEDEQISAEFEVKKANAILILEGKDGQVYNGQVSEIHLDNFTLKFENGGETQHIALEPGDLDFETLPTTAGSYTVILTEQALANVAAKYSNYEVVVFDVKDNYEVSKAPLDTEKTEVNHDHVTGDVTLIIDVNGEKIPIKLDSSVLEWVDGSGNKVDDLTVPGTYYLKVDPEKITELGTNFELVDGILGTLVVEKKEPDAPEPDRPTPLPDDKDDPKVEDTESNIPSSPIEDNKVVDEENEDNNSAEMPGESTSNQETDNQDVEDLEEVDTKPIINDISNWQEWAPAGSHETNGVIKNAQNIVLYQNGHLTRAGRMEIAPKYWAPDGSYRINNLVVTSTGDVITKNGYVTKRGVQILTELPQTSTNGNAKLVALGSLLVSLGIVGLAGTHKKKRKN